MPRERGGKTSLKGGFKGVLQLLSEGPKGSDVHSLPSVLCCLLGKKMFEAQRTQYCQCAEMVGFSGCGEVSGAGSLLPLDHRAVAAE